MCNIYLYIFIFYFFLTPFYTVISFFPPAGCQQDHPTDKTFSSCLLSAASSDLEQQTAQPSPAAEDASVCCLVVCSHLIPARCGQLRGVPAARARPRRPFPMYCHACALGYHSVAHLHPESRHPFAICCSFSFISPLAARPR